MTTSLALPQSVDDLSKTFSGQLLRPGEGVMTMPEKCTTV